MKGKCIAWVMVCFMLGAAVWSNMCLGIESDPGKTSPPDSILCSLYIRRVNESFARSRYGEAKEYFRQAIKINPESQEAWSGYDMATAYTVAEQFKEQRYRVPSGSPGLKEGEDSQKSMSSSGSNTSLNQSQGCQ